MPTQSQDVNFVFNELSADHQRVTIQGQATFSSLWIKCPPPDAAPDTPEKPRLFWVCLKWK